MSLTDQEKILGKCIGRVQTSGSSCSGVITDYSGTMIAASSVMTNVIVGSTVSVVINGKTVSASVIKLTPNNGIVQLRLKKFQDLQPIIKGSTPTTTEKLFCYGYSGTNLAKIEARFTGETHKTVYYRDAKNQRIMVSGLFTLKTTNSNVLPGMAGGPVLNSDGKMIGVILMLVNGTQTAYYLPM